MIVYIAVAIMSALFIGANIALFLDYLHGEDGYDGSQIGGE